MKLNKETQYFFSVRRLHAMLLCWYNRSSQVKLLKTNEADQVFNVAENKTNSITDIFFLKNYFELGLLQWYHWENLS